MPLALLTFVTSLALLGPGAAPPAEPAASYDDLLALFEEWRAFERPPLLDGAPDYTAERFAERYEAFRGLRARLEAIDPGGWPIPQQVDWHLVRAEMNGFDFNHRVLRPWARDPAFYQSIWTHRSDVPDHEGPTHHAVTELWTYEFPLSAEEEARLVSDLSVIPPLMAQARRNLTGNARELWVTGIRNIRQQRETLDRIGEMAGESAGAELRAVLDASRRATDELIAWLEAEAPKKTGPSGIGKDAYTWYQQNVHLVPMTWEDEVRLLERELDRAWASLALEEHRNRDLPPMVPAATPAEYDALADRAASRLIDFLREEEIVTVADYFEPALREHLGEFVPEERRNFFWITAHHDPLPLFTHFWHWFELARMDREPHPSPIRRGALLYNIFDSRNEGTATGVEEMLMHAGLYDDSPRSRELVWILLAQRAARGLGSLYAHANEMTMEEAGRVHMDRTPRGWMKTEKELLIFEQHLYLRQPGYGTSYVTGKYLLERTLADYARQREGSAGAAEEVFRLRDFFDRLHAVGNIPISLARWEMTGLDDEIPAAAPAPPPDSGATLPEALSLLGEPLLAPALPAEVRAERERQLAEARARLEADPGDADAAIWTGRRLGYLGRYREAIAVFSRALERHPRDPRLYRHRGHRFLTLRRLDLAEADLAHAAELVRGRPDQVEPDGLPNALGIPTSTLQSNVWYHLGLARYLQGDFEGALDAYRECLRVSKNPDMLVATSHWLYMTLRRLDRAEEARAVLEPIHAGIEVIENDAYHRLLLLYRGDLEADALLAEASEGGGLDFATVGYGVANWHLYDGRAEEARSLFERIVAAGEWPAFGHLAAEAELARSSRLLR